jgi:hypothetical protein
LADDPRIGAFAATRHGELIGNLVDHVAAAMQDTISQDTAKTQDKTQDTAKT